MNITEVTRLASDPNTVRFLLDGDESFAPVDHPAIQAWEASGGVIAEDTAPEPAIPPLTARQLRLGLVLNGLSLEQVEATIDGIDDPQDRAVAKIEWEYASQFERDHPLLQQVGAALGLTEEQIDSMWEQALTL